MVRKNLYEGVRIYKGEGKRYGKRAKLIIVHRPVSLRGRYAGKRKYDRKKRF